MAHRRPRVVVQHRARILPLLLQLPERQLAFLLRAKARVGEVGVGGWGKGEREGGGASEGGSEGEGGGESEGGGDVKGGSAKVCGLAGEGVLGFRWG